MDWQPKHWHNRGRESENGVIPSYLIIEIALNTIEGNGLTTEAIGT